jgi:hypothetical protein
VRLLAVFFFNLLAFYILCVTIFGKGGIVENTNKIGRINALENSRAANELDVEKLKLRLHQLEMLKSPDHAFLAAQGKKIDNMIIFKFIDQKETMKSSILPDFHFISFRIYITVILVIGFIVFGNLILCYNFKRRIVKPEES